ncbi:Receptor expression-enhancing protein 3 [Taenia crassiceps]|uniref:Receptor expression-enhancing protein 3 n=1 Tax=Taenia crassiceps TaxID=6207 RepID=A0ABR4QKV5_9CEST
MKLNGPRFIGVKVATIFGVLYPAYKSYKALRYKDVKELVCVFEILLVQGSSIIYRKIEIDQYIERAAESSCSALMHFGAKGLTYVANTAIHTAIKSQDLIINHLSQRSLSLDDIRPLALQKPGGDTASTYQSYRGGYNQASHQTSRPSRHRYSAAIPLDNVTELTEEESQNTDSFNAIESGDVLRADHRKSTSDAPYSPFQRSRRHVPVYGRLKHSTSVTSGLRRSVRKGSVSVRVRSFQIGPTTSPQVLINGHTATGGPLQAQISKQCWHTKLIRLFQFCLIIFRERILVFNTDTKNHKVDQRPLLVDVSTVIWCAEARRDVKGPVSNNPYI